MAVVMYSTQICPYCVRAEQLLHQKGVKIEKIMVDRDFDAMTTMMERSQRQTVPQIFIGNYHVGGYDDLARLEMAGELDGLLASDN
ncbi:glutaredoxin 3 [Candidatus Venteria ishoeyi]|uniref:Glutaredoxin n=1 Tax=Candidatus Venteria ishoeyi TaxID=1899563 RepID=A0A1H6FGB7_9GAMM|nr:glutaredoxin 3 [Candidatus Venteria ishoeyi]MDM8546177.1 glutaredoxin 3 [Candidatus Venteria ishoeyi]SEH08044.1 Glutaredoxin-3 [Candidatus Venteria ishoeyi]